MVDVCRNRTRCAGDHINNSKLSNNKSGDCKSREKLESGIIYEMTTDRIWTLIAKKLTGNASARELKELNDLLNSDPVLSEKFKTIEQFFMKRIRKTKK